MKPLRQEAERLMSVDMDRYWLFCYEANTMSKLHDDWKVLKRAGVSFVKATF